MTAGGPGDEPAGAGALPGADPWALRCQMDIPSAGDAGVEVLPAGGAVIACEDGGGRMLLLGTTSGAREWARARLDGGGSGGRAGLPALRGYGARLLAVPVGSAFEAEAAWLRHARARLPRQYALAAEQLEAWCVHVDADAPVVRWRKLSLREAARERPAGLVLGPIADKHAAGRVLEGVVDAFDLCRYEHILAQAPRAQACAYKEMGRCPAPCDGSEPMTSYRSRTRDACGALEDGGAPALRARMATAAGAHEFEEAARLRAAGERLERTARGATGLRRLERCAWVVVAPGPRAGVARLLAIGARGARVAGDVGRSESDPDAAWVRAQSLAMEGPLDEGGAAAIGLALRRLGAGVLAMGGAPARRRLWVIPAYGGTPGDLVQAVARVLQRARGVTEPVEEREASAD